MTFTIRLEEDKGITKLLKRHPKYKEEYWANIYAQGYNNLIAEKFTPVLYALAVCERAMEISREGLKKAGLI
jgi:hypothetical protein